MKCKICGAEAKYSKTGYCNKHATQSLEHRAKNSVGVKRMHETGRGKVFSEEERALARQNQAARKHKEFLEHPDKRYSGETLRFNLLHSGREYRCEKCGIEGVWQGNPIVLEVDHIDGNRHNNQLKNLRFLCPNCHSQTNTFRGRNVNTGRQKVSDEELIIALAEEPNIHAALLRVNLAPKGGNYTRAKKLMAR